MNVNAEAVIAKLAAQVGQLTADLAVQLTLVEQLQQALAARDNVRPSSDGDE